MVNDASVRTFAKLTILLCLAGCEDTAMVETINTLDSALLDARRQSQVLMKQRLQFQKVAPSASVLVAGDAANIERYLVGLGGADTVSVSRELEHLVVRVEGERGRRQAVQTLLTYGVQAPQLELTAIDSKEPKWTMLLRLPRKQSSKTERQKIPSIVVPEPSLFSFSSGEALHRRAKSKAAELVKLQAIIDEITETNAKRAAAAAAMIDTKTITRFAKRRHFALALLPDVQDGSLTYFEDRATWTGAVTFETLDEAKAALAGQAEVLGYAPGPRGSLSAKLSD